MCIPHNLLLHCKFVRMIQPHQADFWDLMDTVQFVKSFNPRSPGSGVGVGGHLMEDIWGGCVFSTPI